MTVADSATLQRSITTTFAAGERLFHSGALQVHAEPAAAAQKALSFLVVRV